MGKGKKKEKENTAATLSESEMRTASNEYIPNSGDELHGDPVCTYKTLSTDSFTSSTEKSEKPVDSNSMVPPKFEKTTLGNPTSLANAVKSCLSQNKVPYLGKTRERSSLTKALVPACTGLEPSSTSVQSCLCQFLLFFTEFVESQEKKTFFLVTGNAMDYLIAIVT